MAAIDLPPVSQLPWEAGHERFIAAAGAAGEEGACCLFVIDASIPASARSGYAALVIAYARASEPVAILEDGAAALLIRSGGIASGQVAARRLLLQMSRLGLQDTLRAGVAPLDGGLTVAIAQARALAAGTDAGDVGVAA